MRDLFVTSVDGNYSLTTLSYILLVVLLVALIVFASFFAKNKNTKKMPTQQLVFCAIAMALALVTSYLEIYSFPFGGSVTLFSMLFICLIGYLYGAKTSIIVGVAYGILQFVIKPYIYHPAQILLDYPLAFGALGLSGLFYKSKNGLLKGYLVGITGRWLFTTLSGYIFFGSYAWEGWNPLLYSMAYNGAYIYAEGIATVIIISLPLVKNAFDQVKKMSLQD
ncbi:energy-coupled thiamine transporter ThiT [Lachnoclostridium sp.]|uniref:energy-coupled thiamine transporter ThiT n=1 Tax=Lachnoclostridium sp. TaxID=2028282 RepID=UPI00289EF6DD|nr:energy-coupled thiamine transporter ThiT [Lachnoclostridium sp.]